jgi:hypothetical protein
VLSGSLDERGARGAALALDPAGTLYASSRRPSAGITVRSLGAD